MTSLPNFTIFINFGGNYSADTTRVIPNEQSQTSLDESAPYLEAHMLPVLYDMMRMRQFLDHTTIRRPQSDHTPRASQDYSAQFPELVALGASPSLLASLMMYQQVMQMMTAQNEQQQNVFLAHPHASDRVKQALKILHPDEADQRKKLFQRQPTCVVCTDEFQAQCGDDSPKGGQDPGKETDTIRQMPCGHIFHESCLFTWLRSSNKCPLCRYELETDNEDFNKGVRERNKVFLDMNRCDADEISMCWLHDTAAREGSDENQPPAGAPEEKPSMVLLPECSHQYHRTCLEHAVRIAEPEYALSLEEAPIRCPRCRKASRVTSLQQKASPMGSV